MTGEKVIPVTKQEYGWMVITWEDMEKNIIKSIVPYVDEDRIREEVELSGGKVISRDGLDSLFKDEKIIEEYDDDAFETEQERIEERKIYFANRKITSGETPCNSQIDEE